MQVRRHSCQPVSAMASHKILIVGKRADIAERVATRLRDLGHTAVSLGTVGRTEAELEKEATQKLRSEPWDVAMFGSGDRDRLKR